MRKRRLQRLLTLNDQQIKSMRHLRPTIHQHPRIKEKEINIINPINPMCISNLRKEPKTKLIIKTKILNITIIKHLTNHIITK